MGLVELLELFLRNLGYRVERYGDVLKVDNTYIAVFRCREGPRITRDRSGGRTDIIRIRCSEFTRCAFYSFADKIGAPTLEDALLELMRRAGVLGEPPVMR